MVHAHNMLLSDFHGTEMLLPLPTLLRLTLTRTYMHMEYLRQYYISYSPAGRTSLQKVV
jgi:hypothetical protein